MCDKKMDGVLKARRSAMDYLARRDHSALELQRKLTAKGYDHPVISQVLAELVEDGLQSDQRFAQAWVASRARRGKGPVRIRGELKERGVAAGLINTAFDGAQVDWFELADGVLEKKLAGNPLKDLKERAKASRFLHYRGFESEQIRYALENRCKPSEKF